MAKRILIEHAEGKRQIALVRDRELMFFDEGQTEGIRAEDIFLAVVDRQIKGMEAAFVRLGKEQTGFLPYAECLSPVRSGDKRLVQVKKPAIGEKAPYLTEDISLAGRFLILTPRCARCAVSQRIADEEERAVLLEAAHRLSPDGMGLIMRTEAQGVPEETLVEELCTLTERWRAILTSVKTAHAPCLILGREDTLQRLLRDEKGQVTEILTDQPDEVPSAVLPVRFSEHPFALYQVHAQWEKALRRKFWLDCGGFLITDKTEALTVIDVNSGKFTGKAAGAEETFLRLNLEAARAVARLLRLRSIGGIILIDFVDMEREESRQKVAAALEEALRDDPVKTVLHGFTHLGLMEMTRKKTENVQSERLS